MTNLASDVWINVKQYVVWGDGSNNVRVIVMDNNSDCIKMSVLCHLHENTTNYDFLKLCNVVLIQLWPGKFHFMAPLHY